MNLKEALAILVPDLIDQFDQDPRAVLLDAARETWQRRKINGQAGGVVLAALQDPDLLGDQALSQRGIEREIGIPRSTVGRWSLPPGSD